MSYFTFLKSAGLTNNESEDYGSIASGKRLAPVPFCYSPKCTAKTTRACVQKIVRGYPDACPDCGWSLRWTKVHVDYTSAASSRDA
jgi:hypothetical protein